MVLSTMDQMKIDVSMISEANAEICNKIAGEQGFYVTMMDIANGYIGDTEDEGGTGILCNIEIVQIIENGGLRVKLWLDGLEETVKDETIDLVRIELPDGGVIYATEDEED